MKRKTRVKTQHKVLVIRSMGRDVACITVNLPVTLRGAVALFGQKAVLSGFVRQYMTDAMNTARQSARR